MIREKPRQFIGRLIKLKQQYWRRSWFHSSLPEESSSSGYYPTLFMPRRSCSRQVPWHLQRDVLRLPRRVRSVHWTRGATVRLPAGPAARTWGVQVLQRSELTTLTHTNTKALIQVRTYTNAYSGPFNRWNPKESLFCQFKYHGMTQLSSLWAICTTHCQSSSASKICNVRFKQPH